MIWNDDKALLKWVSENLPDPPRDWLVMPWHQWHGPFTGPDREREAIAAAAAGDFKLLGILMQQKVPLDLEAKALLAAKLTGEFKVGRGRPKRTIAQRRAVEPIHEAADQVTVIQELLRQRFPKQTGLRDRAIDMAAALYGVKRERLAQQMRSKHRLAVHRPK